jgi:UDP-N-acetylmuramoyl-tripeptide--D-alanyl-D-alanine ligase
MNLEKIKHLLNAELVGQDVSFEQVSTDTRTIPKDSLFVALEGPMHDGHRYLSEALKKGAKAVLVTKRSQVPENASALVVPDSIEALGQLAKYHRLQFNVPCIAVTGSCGKTTVRSMINSILSLMGKTLTPKANYNNHIGMPLTLLNLNAEHQYIVLEMGASAPFEIAYLSTIGKQNIALVTNVHPAHLEGFKTQEGVATAKAEIYEGLDDDGVAVLDLDSPYAQNFKKVIGQRKIISYGTKHEAMIRADNIMKKGLGFSFTLTTPKGKVEVTLKVPGQHNVTNALAACACVYSLDVPLTVIQKALESFSGVSGRMKVTQLRREITLIDDTYNANPGSFEVAIDFLKQCTNKKILVVGDMGELGVQAREQHHALGIHAKSQGIDALYAIGTLSKLAVESFGEKAKWFNDKQGLLDALKRCSSATILVKGSRSMQMDTVIDAIKTDKDN